jgi:hypothetical protein
MSTRIAASSSSSKRKRRSASATPAESPAKRRTTRGAGGASAAPVADPPTLVPVAPPTGGWCASMHPAREAGQFIDITLLVGDRKIPAHKVALVYTATSVWLGSVGLVSHSRSGAPPGAESAVPPPAIVASSGSRRAIVRT